MSGRVYVPGFNNSTYPIKELPIDPACTTMYSQESQNDENDFEQNQGIILNYLLIPIKGIVKDTTLSTWIEFPF